MSTPIDFFTLFFNQILLQMIVDQTNLYFTQRKPGTQFVELTARELQAFFGMVVMISIKGLTVLEHIWSTLAFFHDASLANIMPRDRFFWILRNLHFNNNNEAPEDPAQDRLFKIRPVIHHLTTQFQVQYNLHEHFAGDEAMVIFQGRHSGKQYDPSKPIKRGFKIWTLADSISGYVYNFAVYMGRFGNPDHRDLGRRVILNLITPDLHNLNYRLYCDRFFTSMPLLRDLQERIGIYCCGTVQRDRQGYSPSLKQLKQHEKNMERGEFHFAKHDDGMCGYAWNDKKLIYFLSSAHSGDLPLTAVMRNIDIRGNRTNIPCPQAIADYNKYMGGEIMQIKSSRTMQSTGNCVAVVQNLKQQFDVSSTDCMLNHHRKWSETDHAGIIKKAKLDEGCLVPECTNREKQVKAMLMTRIRASYSTIDMNISQDSTVTSESYSFNSPTSSTIDMDTSQLNEQSPNGPTTPTTPIQQVHVEIAPIDIANDHPTKLIDEIDGNTQESTKETELIDRNTLKYQMLAPCNCSKKCLMTIPEERRSDIHHQFWKQPYSMRRAWLYSHIKVIEPSRMNKRPESHGRRKHTRVYKLPNSEGCDVFVCKVFFLHTSLTKLSL
ncbi:piggyBac transposable element-derived protein 2-like [Antedon mediterranea]|uniref:piggyBac transposable element-derived protein 2-like n=1 Tax=Antedon mediterranea TaxID=105859 RepID=UPI003AF6612B